MFVATRRQEQLMDRLRKRFKGRSVLVVGLGRSGLAAARQLLAAGADVSATDMRAIDRLGAEADLLERTGVKLTLGGHPDEIFAGQDAIIVSPGVPTDLPQLVAARGSGIEILSEIDLAEEALGSRTLAVTGSNGKSTTVALAAEMLSASGFDAVPCGNIGTPFVDAVREDHDGRRYSLELSSFQLETASALRAACAVLLNVQPDHLDRHGSLERYRDAKWRIADLRTEGAPLVLAVDDPLVAPLARSARGPVLQVSCSTRVPAGGWLDAGILKIDRGDGSRTLATLDELPLYGLHNVTNVLAAALAAMAVGADIDGARKALLGFRPLAHRLQEVVRVRGIRFVDDSKATNVAAAVEAIGALAASCEGRVHVLLGGRDKDSDFAPLARAIDEVGASALTFGEAGPLIESILTPRVATYAGTLEEAVVAAFDRADGGDVVLLAPACASFDAFPGFEARGLAFADAARMVSRSADGGGA